MRRTIAESMRLPFRPTIGNGGSKNQDDASTTRARGNIQRFITVLHDIYDTVMDDTVMDDKKFLQDFEYLYEGGYAVFPALRDGYS